jgi:hypothetical protein
VGSIVTIRCCCCCCFLTTDPTMCCTSNSSLPLFSLCFAAAIDESFMAFGSDLSALSACIQRRAAGMCTEGCQTNSGACGMPAAQSCVHCSATRPVPCWQVAVGGPLVAQ